MTDNTANKTPVAAPAAASETSYLQSTKDTLSSTFGPVSDALSEYTQEVKVIYCFFLNFRNGIRSEDPLTTTSLDLALDICPVHFKQEF
jgi:hypothetical protein